MFERQGQGSNKRAKVQHNDMPLVGCAIQLVFGVGGWIKIDKPNLEATWKHLEGVGVDAWPCAPNLPSGIYLHTVLHRPGGVIFAALPGHPPPGNNSLSPSPCLGTFTLARQPLHSCTLLIHHTHMPSPTEHELSPCLSDPTCQVDPEACHLNQQYTTPHHHHPHHHPSAPPLPSLHPPTQQITAHPSTPPLPKKKIISPSRTTRAGKKLTR